MKTLKRALAACGAAVVCALVATSCQQKPYPIFFMQEEPGGVRGTSAKFIITYRGKAYTRSPLITHNEIESYHSFMSMQDGSYGVVFTLKRPWHARLFGATQKLRGALILPVVNGLAFEPVLVDAPIRDGRLVIWNGLNGYDLKQIARTIRPEDPEMEKKRFKSKNPRPLPKLAPDDRNTQKDHTGRTIGEIFASGV